MMNPHLRTPNPSFDLSNRCSSSVNVRNSEFKSIKRTSFPNDIEKNFTEYLRNRKTAMSKLTAIHKYAVALGVSKMEASPPTTTSQKQGPPHRNDNNGEDCKKVDAKKNFYDFVQKNGKLISLAGKKAERIVGASNEERNEKLSSSSPKALMSQDYPLRKNHVNSNSNTLLFMNQLKSTTPRSSITQIFPSRVERKILYSNQPELTDSNEYEGKKVKSESLEKCSGKGSGIKAHVAHHTKSAIKNSSNPQLGFEEANLGNSHVACGKEHQKGRHFTTNSSKQDDETTITPRQNEQRKDKIPSREKYTTSSKKSKQERKMPGKLRLVGSGSSKLESTNASSHATSGLNITSLISNNKTIDLKNLINALVISGKRTLTEEYHSNTTIKKTNKQESSQKALEKKRKENLLRLKASMVRKYDPASGSQAIYNEFSLDSHRNNHRIEEEEEDPKDSMVLSSRKIHKLNLNKETLDHDICECDEEVYGGLILRLKGVLESYKKREALYVMKLQSLSDYAANLESAIVRNNCNCFLENKF